VARRAGETRRSTVAGEAVDAFVPYPLPPSAPRLALESLGEVLPRAQLALARLDLAGEPEGTKPGTDVEEVCN